MIQSSCHCGAVTLEFGAAPTEVTDCSCSICRRYGVLWAYYPLASVSVKGPTDTYLWGDCSIAFHRCKTCGCVTHWSPVNRAEGRMGVNTRLMPPEVLAKALVRHLDGAKTERYLD